MSSSYQHLGGKTNACLDLVSGYDWWWFYMSYSGSYNIYVDPEENCFYVMSSGWHPDELPTKGPALHETYYSLENTYENEIVKVNGQVLAKNGFGYILSMTGGPVLVYDPYHRLDIDLGYSIDLYAAVKTYNGLKELDVTEVCWYYVMDGNYYDYTLSNPLKLESLSSYESSSYDYLSVTGRLKSSYDANSGRTNYTVVVESPEYFEVVISQPYQDLDALVGKTVIIEGFHLGHYYSNSVPTLKIMLKRIWDTDLNAGGSTEEVLPGGSIIVTNN
jgi:hypothetical protein